MHFTLRENSRAKGLHLSGSLLDKHRFLLFCFLIGTSIERQHWKRNVHRFVTMVTTNVIWYATEMIAHKYATLIHVIWIARGQRAIRLATQM